VDPIEAAVGVASRFGLVVEDPLVLHDSNNTVVWLRPHAVVAKVATGHHRRLDLEMAVGRHLAACGAPVVAPADALPQMPHRLGGLEATFWTYEHQAEDQELDEEQLALALDQVHRALNTFPGALPDFDDELDSVATVLSDPVRSPALGTTDRALLLSALSLLRRDLAACASPQRALHGSPHNGNVLFVQGKVLFIDFETVCRGPLEWDLAHVGDGVLRAYPACFDSTALRLCQGLVSVKTAAWCWARYEHKDLRWHARHHLAQVHRLMANRMH
jgi:predicted trehalose synthase